MNVNEVIKYPILTEKTYAQMENKVYTFAVDNRTNKAEVKKVIEFIFQVKVAKVNILKVAKKAAKLGKFEGFKSSYKKAIVYLLEGDIQLFPDEAANAEASKEVKRIKPAKSAPIEMSEAEKKAQAKIEAKLNEAKKVETTEEAKPVEPTVEVKAKAKPVEENVVTEIEADDNK
jgi:large subunit ribosomal protein L23